MKLSAYPIGKRVWIVATEKAGSSEIPATLPIGSVILEPEEAARFGAQVLAAGLKVEEREAAARG